MRLGVIILDFEGDDQAPAMLKEALTWPVEEMTIYYVQVSKRRALSSDEQIRMIFSEHNLGFGGNNNLGITASLQDENDWTLLINNDASIGKKEITSLLHKAAEFRSSHVFSLAPSLIEENGMSRKEYVGGRDISQYLNTRIEKAEMEPTATAMYEVFYNIGAILLLNNAHLKEVGLLDEDYFFSGEVADLCYRAAQRDLQNICLLDVTSSHFPEDHARRRTLYKYYSLRNRFVFIRKHGLPRARMRQFYRFLAKDLLYQIFRLDKEQVRTNWICLVDSFRGLKGNQNHKFKV